MTKLESFVYIMLYFSLLASGNNFHLYLNGNKQTSVMRYKDGYVNMNSHTSLYEYHKNDKLLVTSDTTCSSCGITWTLWALGLAMKTHVSFMLGRTSSFVGSSDRVDFDSVVLDEANGWNGKARQYVVKATGIYSLSLATACPARKDNDFKLYINGQQQFYNYCDNINHAEETVTTSRNLMILLTKDDVLYLTADSFKGLSYFGGYSDATLQTSFSGFLYDPFHGCPVAWSVARTSSLKSTAGPLDPVDFDQVLVNVGRAWNSLNKAECTTSGTYIVYLNS